jgi:hypothetical protein
MEVGGEGAWIKNYYKYIKAIVSFSLKGPHKNFYQHCCLLAFFLSRGGTLIVEFG